MSNSKIITYDLRAPGRDYKNLIDIIKSYSIWAKLTESSWFISTTETCVVVRDKLLKVMDSNDRIFVAELTGEAAWRNLICDQEYVKKHL